MYIWYKLLTYLFYPFAPIYLYFRVLKKKEDPLRYKEKLSRINIPRAEGFVVWLHFASVGEAMSTFPLIENLLNNKKINRILLTSITLSSSKVLKKKFGKNLKIIHQFLPLDIPTVVNKFLNHWKPNLSIFIDSEIWPNLILKINERKIPLLLINARITKKSFKRWKLLKNFAKKIFQKFDLCVVSNKESEHFLKFLGATNIKNYGNLKFAGTVENLNNFLNPLFLNKIENRKIWCAASTHSNEEILCGKVHLKIKKEHHSVLTIIIPRHIDRTKKICAELLNLNLKVVFYSQFDQVDNNTDIIIVDSYGGSSKFYNISKYVFVGKSLIQSLVNDGGQNPIEAARYGCKIFHGPHVSNFAEIYEYLHELNITKEINNIDELGLSLVEEFKGEKNKNGEIATKIQKYGQNILNNLVMELKKYI